MIFHPSPALHKIRQLARLIRRDPVPRRPCHNTPWPGQDLPDPEQFIDSSVPGSIAGFEQAGSRACPKRMRCPSRNGR
jgi:hypothetical protein